MLDSYCILRKSREKLVMFTQTTRGRVVTLAVAIVAAASLMAGSASVAGDKCKDGDKTAQATTETGDLVLRGEPIGDSPTVTLAALLKDPDKYEGKSVVLEGVADAVCQKKGCWMEVVSEPGKQGIRVTFKDYGFFVPMDAGGMVVRAEGMIEIKTLDKEYVDHLAEEGASIKRNPDGTATEIGFVATGVELRKSVES